MITTTPSSTILATRARGRWRVVFLVLLTGLSWYSTAISWLAQFVMYPLFRSVGPQEFADFHLDYNDSIPLVVVLPGFLTFLAGAAFPWLRPQTGHRVLAAVVSVASIVALLTTVLWAIPKHDELDRSGQSDATIDSLLDASLLRSVALTAVTVGLTWIVLAMLNRSQAPTAAATSSPD